MGGADLGWLFRQCFLRDVDWTRVLVLVVAWIIALAILTLAYSPISSIQSLLWIYQRRHDRPRQGYFIHSFLLSASLVRVVRGGDEVLLVQF